VGRIDGGEDLVDVGDGLDAVEVGPDGDDLDTGGRRGRGDLAVERCRVVAQFGHEPQHRDAAPRGDGRQRLERGPHRRRVRVVGVVEHDAARGQAHEVHTRR